MPPKWNRGYTRLQALHGANMNEMVNLCGREIAVASLESRVNLYAQYRTLKHERYKHEISCGEEMYDWKHVSITLAYLSISYHHILISRLHTYKILYLNTWRWWKSATVHTEHSSWMAADRVKNPFAKLTAKLLILKWDLMYVLHSTNSHYHPLILQCFVALG